MTDRAMREGHEHCTMVWDGHRWVCVAHHPS